MASDKTSLPITFSLTVRNKVEDLPDKVYSVHTASGQTLLQALKHFEKTNTTFNFETQKVPSSGPYVVAVMGQRKGSNKFWSTLLYNPVNCDVTPINFDYKVGSGNSVFLLYSNF